MRIVARAKRTLRHDSKAQSAREFDKAVAEFFMRLALEEAKKGLGHTSPNPVVGAVLVRNGHVIARGYHKKAGGPHAEIVAMRRAGAKTHGADLYATLEPCNHYGRTPPCTEAIIEAGIRRVFVGCQDANPMVAGRGIRRLRAAGIPVITGVLKDECFAINRPFFTFITKKRPFVTLKIAATADGKIAAANGQSRWITGTKARESVHLLRGRVDAVLVGAGTVRQDDPQLTARPRGKSLARQPLRVVLCSKLDFCPSARIFSDSAGPVVILTSDSAEVSGASAELSERKIEIVRLPNQNDRGCEVGRIDLAQVLQYLAKRNVMHLLVEGGASIFGAFLEQSLADQVMLYIAPKIIGEGLSWAKLAKPRSMAEPIILLDTSVELVGGDVLVVGKPALPQDL